MSTTNNKENTALFKSCQKYYEKMNSVEDYCWKYIDKVVKGLGVKNENGEYILDIKPTKLYEESLDGNCVRIIRNVSGTLSFENENGKFMFCGNSFGIANLYNFIEVLNEMI